MYLGNYEIFACEPLHDIENHIKNLFEELPHHMADTKRLLILFLQYLMERTVKEVLIIVLV